MHAHRVHQPPSTRHSMWCRSCQQDVPGITTGVVPRAKCARCGGVLPRGGFALPHLSYCDVLESGVDLMAIEVAPAARDMILLHVDGEIRDRLREVGCLLKQPPPLRPRLHRRPLDGLCADGPAGGQDLEYAFPLSDGGGGAAAPQPAEHSSTFFWAAVAAMFALLLALSLIWPDLLGRVASRLR